MKPLVFFPAPGESVEGPRFRFRGASGACEWPRSCGARLGPAGAWNALWRLGWTAPVANASQLPRPAPDHRLFVAASGPLTKEDGEALSAWIDRQGAVVATGPAAAWGRFFPGLTLEDDTPENPYAALGLREAGPSTEIVAPPGWRFFRAKRIGDGIEGLGSLVALHGERHTPTRALASPLEDAPGALRSGRLVFLNGDPFAALQAWLQGQEDLGPWLAWRHRLFWLDEHVAFLGRLLRLTGALGPDDVGPGVAGLPATTVVLRHDLDSSRDTAYLEEELSRGVAGVHGILRDGNTRFWVERLVPHAEQETALHYNTLDSSWLGRRLESLRRAPAAARASRSATTGRGLLRQVTWARAQGIGVDVLLRHGPFLVYPEWVDALHHVLEQEPTVRGSSSLFRAQVLRWGVDRVDGAQGSVADFPDSQFPFWFPFRLAHSGLGGRMLRGWESTSLMEAEPDLVEQMLDHEVPGIPQRVLTLGYHPAHARSSTFARSGLLPAFRRLLEILRERGVVLRASRDVHRLCDGAFAKAALHS